MSDLLEKKGFNILSGLPLISWMTGLWFVLQSGLVMLMTLCFLGVSAAKGPLREPPVTVTIAKLSMESDQYDGQRIIVTGRVRSIEVQTGRRGSSYAMLVIEEMVNSPKGPVPSVNVIILSIPSVYAGNDVLVQGVYHREGKQAGKTFEHFIDAEAVLREKL